MFLGEEYHMYLSYANNSNFKCRNSVGKELWLVRMNVRCEWTWIIFGNKERYIVQVSSVNWVWIFPNKYCELKSYRSPNLYLKRRSSITQMLTFMVISSWGEKMTWEKSGPQRCYLDSVSYVFIYNQKEKKERKKNILHK